MKVFCFHHFTQGGSAPYHPRWRGCKILSCVLHPLQTTRAISGSLIGLTLIPALAFLLSGCASRQTTPREEIVLEFWTLQLDAFKNTLQPMFRTYEQTHPPIKIR